MLTWVAAVLVVLLFARVYEVHDRTWEVRLFPSATPPKVQYDGRDYRRAEPVSRVDPSLVLSGRTWGGGVVFAAPGTRTSTVIDVVDGDRVVAYDLMGGP